MLIVLNDCDEEVPNIEPEMWHSYSREKLTSYTDYLAPRLLEPWDIENESDWPVPVSPAPSNTSSSDQSADFTDKVNRWISAYSGKFIVNPSIIISSKYVRTCIHL